MVEADGRVSRWLNREDERGWLKNRVNAGLHILSPDILKGFDRPVKRALDRDVLLHLPVYYCLCLMLEERFFGGR